MGGLLSNPTKNPRLEMLRSFIEKRPGDPFPRYALAMELKTAGDALAAWQTFEALIAEYPDYIASYSPAGEVLVGLDRIEEARVVLSKGMDACSKKNDVHMRDHLESALAELDRDR
jgi:predicted Zn-dependent protease